MEQKPNMIKEGVLGDPLGEWGCHPGVGEGSVGAREGEVVLS